MFNSASLLSSEKSVFVCLLHSLYIRSTKAYIVPLWVQNWIDSHYRENVKSEFLSTLNNYTYVLSTYKLKVKHVRTVLYTRIYIRKVKTRMHASMCTVTASSLYSYNDCSVMYSRFLANPISAQNGHNRERGGEADGQCLSRSFSLSLSHPLSLSLSTFGAGAQAKRAAAFFELLIVLSRAVRRGAALCGGAPVALHLRRKRVAPESYASRPTLVASPAAVWRCGPLQYTERIFRNRRV